MKKLLFALLLIAATAAHAQTAQPASKVFKLTSGKASFVMDAPLEKIKGEGKVSSGEISLKGNDYGSVTGWVEVDLSTFATHTFGDAEKDKLQTEHMLNWFEIGDEVTKDVREKFKHAKFVIESTKIKSSSNSMTIVAVQGSINLHGITKPVTSVVSVVMDNNKLTIKSIEPFTLSLVDHDIKPRDLAGKLLDKTLDALGQKVSKTPQVSIEAQFE